MTGDTRRAYYDHEAAYRRIAATGGRGWDDLFPPGQGSYDALAEFLASGWCPAPGAAVLELGCGGGQAALAVARLGHRVVGVDYAETAIELAQRNAAEGGLDVRFERGDALALGAIGAFDVVIDNHLLHCIVGDDRARVAAEIRRVLRPGGVVFSETMSCEGPFDPAAVDADPQTCVARNGSRFWTSRAELEALLAGAGLAIEYLAPRPQAVGTTLVTYARRP